MFFVARKKPAALVLSGLGLNCEEETSFALHRSGAEVSLRQACYFFKNPDMLRNYQILVIPGGFSFGDMLGSGKMFSFMLSDMVRDELDRFLNRDVLAAGICNGCQIFISSGLIGKKGTVAITSSESNRYFCSWVNLNKNKNSLYSPWFSNIRNICLPIAHCEGRFVFSDDFPREQIVLSYENDVNGSEYRAAALVSGNGKIAALMPHPERAFRASSSIGFFVKKDLDSRVSQKVNNSGAGAIFFQNAVNYFKH